MSETLVLPLDVAAPARLVRVAERDVAGGDERLLARIAQGDGAAFEALYRRYAPAVLGMAKRRLGDGGRAEDAVQETFVAVWRSASTFRPERGRASAWLYAVARNAIADRGRRRGDPVAEAPELPSDDATPAEVAEHDWLAWRVHRAVEELPPHERELVELAYWGGLSQSEIAERVSIPLGTVKTRTRSALARLAEALEEELG